MVECDGGVGSNLPLMVLRQGAIFLDLVDLLNLYGHFNNDI